MLSAAFKDRMKEKFTTPRRRRQGAVLLVLFVVYSLLGLFAAPGLVIQQAQKFVHEKLKLELSVQKLEVNPWLLAVRLDGLSLREPGAGGEVLVSARSVYVNAQLWSSLWLRGASLDEVDLLEPYVNARIRKDGSINLMQLVPPDDPKDKSEARWRIGTLGVHGGRIDFHDDTRPTPFKAMLSPLNLGLSELSSRPNKDGGYTLHAETGDGEALDWHGTVAMKPVRSQGELKISHLKATTPWRYLQDQLPVIVDGGYIGISGHYQLEAAGDVTFALDNGRVVVEKLALHQRGDEPLAVGLGQLDLEGVAFAWPARAASFGALTLRDLHVADTRPAGDLVCFDTLLLQDGRYRATPEIAELTRLQLDKLVLTDADGGAPLLSLPGLTLQKLAVALTDRKLQVQDITLEKGDLSVRREKNGSLNWQTRLDHLARRLAQNTLPATAPEKAPEKTVHGKKQKAAPAETAWAATLGQINLAGFRVAVEDRVPQPAVKTSLDAIDMRVLPRQSSADAHALEGSMSMGTGGTLALKGTFSEQPLSVRADIDLQGLKLPPFAPYFTDFARFALESGLLDIGGTVNFTQARTTQADFNGRVAVRDFAANDLEQDERFLAWRQIAVNGIRWQLAPGRLAIRDILADRPFMRVIVAPDHTINLSHVVAAAPPEQGNQTAAPAPSATAKAADNAYPLRIDRIRMQDGSMLFADLTLKPQFATGIQSLNGDISGLSTDPASRAKVELDGRVDQYGKAVITGTTNPLAGDKYTDIAVKFSNLELTTLTPYSAKFAGYRIDKGKLSLDLNYKINNRQLDASNKIVFNQLTLGEKVDSPDAVNLPLKLAVAILKDKDGVIDVDLPVTGSLDDPQFRIAPLVWKAFVNLLTKAATAPFKLLAGLVGGGDDLDSLVFVPGQTALAEAETAKLDKLAEALAKRPALGVEIRGSFDPQADALAIRTAKFETVYQKRLADSGKPRKVLEALFKEKLGSEALAQQRALSLKPAEDAAKTKDALQLAEDSYLKSLRDELIARETVLDGDLRQLALERARTVRTRLVETDKVDEARIFMLDPVTSPATDDKIIMKVSLTAS